MTSLKSLRDLKVREWWIGRTADSFDKWLTTKHPEEEACRNVFISTDGSDPCVEYIPVIDKRYADLLLKIIEVQSEIIEGICSRYEAEPENASPLKKGCTHGIYSVTKSSQAAVEKLISEWRAGK